MKRIVKFIILSLVLVVLLPIFGGCEFFSRRDKAEKYCNDYLAAIPVEYAGYKIRYCENNVYEGLTVPNRGGQYTINEKEIIIEYEGGYKFKIIYKGEETVIDKEFMSNNSEAYNKINNVWKGYDKENPDGWDMKSEVFNVFVYDNNLFILTFCDNTGLMYKPEKIIPISLYRYDFGKKEVQFCDFIKLGENRRGDLIIYKK